MKTITVTDSFGKEDLIAPGEIRIKRKLFIFPTKLEGIWKIGIQNVLQIAKIDMAVSFDVIKYNTWNNVRFVGKNDH